MKSLRPVSMIIDFRGDNDLVELRKWLDISFCADEISSQLLFVLGVWDFNKPLSIRTKVQ